MVITLIQHLIYLTHVTMVVGVSKIVDVDVSIYKKIPRYNLGIFFVLIKCIQKEQDSE